MSKKRGSNFTRAEKDILMELVFKYKHIIENKKTDAVTTAAKNEGWRSLAETFNSTSGFEERSAEQLRNCWDNIKRTTRKDRAELRKELFMTGGGKPTVPPEDGLSKKMEVILGPTLEGLSNPFDADSLTEEVIMVTQPAALLSQQPETSNSEGHTTALQGFTIEEDDSAGTTSLKSNGGQESNSGAISIVDAIPQGLQWKNWSASTLKLPVSSALATTPKKATQSWINRRRPRESISDKLVKEKIELVQLMKEVNKCEAEKRMELLNEQLKQERLKTELLELELKKKKHED